MTSGTATATRSEVRSGLVSQLSRFVVVGALSAMVDFGIYHALLHAGMFVHLAKAASFICGTTTAYLLNRRFTFSGNTAGAGRFVGFLVLYGTTFFVNVGMNALALHLLPADLPHRFSVGWVIAQGTATTINFLVLRTLVFRAR